MADKSGAQEYVNYEDKMSAISEFLRRPDNYDWLFADCKNDNDPEEFDRVIRHIMGLEYEEDLVEATLFTGLERMGSPDFARLMRYGCYANLPDKFQLTPLHLAILHGNVDKAHDLLEHGADLDVQDSIAGETPLFYAIKSGNMELTCMLLCYNADVTIQNAVGHNALIHAMEEFKQDIISILIDYYDDFNDSSGFTDNGYCALEIAMELDDADVFNKIWSMMDVDILLEDEFPLLMTYIMSDFSTKEWVECLHLMLESSIAADLIYQCRVYCASLQGKGFITELLDSLNRKGVPSNDRQNIISICLSLGAEVTGTDLGVALHLFGFEEELEMLIYATNCYQNDAIQHPLLPLIIGSSDMKLPDMILQYRDYVRCKYPLIVLTTKPISKFMVSYMRFFSLTPFWKLELFPNYQQSRTFVKDIEPACEFPSLLELSRNRVHSLVRKGSKPQKPYQFLDAMKSLPLPGAVIDILLFKSPIYTCPDQFNVE